MLPYLERVQALIAEEGGLTSDAAIMGLNTGIQVIVGARDATRILENDMLVTVDTPQAVYSGYQVYSSLALGSKVAK